MRLFRFASPGKLRKAGVLCMNARNHSYIFRYNNREFYPRVDDKLQTKLLAEREGIAVPYKIGVIETQRDVDRFKELIQGKDQFAIKPTRGSAGRGILVITGRDGDMYLKGNGQRVSARDIYRHISNILSGLYSLGGLPDKALFEDLIQFTSTFDRFSYQGVPDVRIIVFQGFPVMAMMRLSTAASDGKANLHQGAVGVGLNLVTGKASRAVQFNRPLEKHPDTGSNLFEVEVPMWQEHLELASRCYEITELGYFGADIVIDRNRGPLLLELNARPGLAIQSANRVGLETRLSAVKAIGGRTRKQMLPQERVEWSLAHFG
jgi:alpha-L-glutamate ligase-like protein